MADAQHSTWPDLPPELLGLVLKRLPSLADRVRLKAVCRPWRSNARMQSPPPPLPWLVLLDGTFLSIPDGETHHIPTSPDDASCYGSIDNWLLLEHRDGGCSLMNPFSKTTLDLPNPNTIWSLDWFNEGSKYKPLFYKSAVPSPGLGLSPDSLVAVLTKDGFYGSIIATEYSRNSVPLFSLSDVAFFDGKLHTFSMSFYGIDLAILEGGEITTGTACTPRISFLNVKHDSGDHEDIATDTLLEEGPHMIKRYILKYGGRLLVLSRHVRSVASSTGHNEPQRTAGFKIFEADLSSKPARFRRVNELGGHALFLSQHSSKALPACEGSGVQEDCIYFMGDYSWPDYGVDPLRDSGVYNMRTGTITPLLSGTAAVPSDRFGSCRPIWFFPGETM